MWKNLISGIDMATENEDRWPKDICCASQPVSMCLLFFAFNPNPEPLGYYLILANTRDEFYDRPARSCQFWDENHDILGGMDLIANLSTSEAGTWLGMNVKRGKIAALLNSTSSSSASAIASEYSTDSGTKISRGYWIRNYLENGLSGKEYLKSLCTLRYSQKRFHLITFDLNTKISASFFTNSEGAPFVESLKPGIYAFGNCLPHKPWEKVKAGKRMFTRIIAENAGPRKKEFLIEELFRMLSDRTMCFPDPQLQLDVPVFNSLEEQKFFSSIFIRIADPIWRYGSRTHSLVLIDTQWNVDFIEKSMPEGTDEHPLLDPPLPSEWIVKRFSFNMKNTSNTVVPHSRL